MKFKDDTVLPAPTTATLDWFESAHKFVFPEAFKKVLNHYNGGTPENPFFMQGFRERMIECFLPILEDPGDDSKNGAYDISVVLTQLDERIVSDLDYTGYEIVPIAALFGGDFVCMDFRENPKAPTIVVWDHEMSDDLSPVVELVSNSMDEFLKNFD